MKKPTERLAVVLMNLGGPDSLGAVRPFLSNLFSDPAIISLPSPFRQVVAQIISRSRAPKARKIYQAMGGSSPLLKNTTTQLELLQKQLLESLPHCESKVFIAMRYWNPLIRETVAQVKEYIPTQIILLPLYPQFSSTTTGSSFREWDNQAIKIGLNIPTTKVHSYADDTQFIDAHVKLLQPWIAEAKKHGSPRILFSAHGLPQKVIDAGDPYETHIHQTVNAIMDKIPSTIESVICYQSKVGPLKWLSPSIDQALHEAAQVRKPVIIVPISFVSEHVETLVELDQEYRDLAIKMGIPFYGRVPTLGGNKGYIQALASLAIRKIEEGSYPHD
jgi:ferrochelatase